MRDAGGREHFVNVLDGFVGEGGQHGVSVIPSHNTLHKQKNLPSGRFG